jgi:cytochrome P450
MTDIDVERLDITDPSLYGAGVPHDAFTALRQAGGVHRHRTTRTPRGEPYEFWSVVRHAEIQHVNRDWQTFTAIDGPGLIPTEVERRGQMIVSMDPPDHSRLRKLISAGFTPRMVAELEGSMVRWTSRILDDVSERGECDFVRDVAYQLPMHVIADIVGIPEPDRPWVFHHAEAMLKGLDPSSGLTAEDRATAERELFLYAQTLGRERRANPTDDVWTVLSRAEIVGDDGTATELTDFELDLFFLILTLAGSETTRNAISQGLVALLDHPDQLRALRDDRSLLHSATDEMIRWASPVLFFGRTATRDVELAGAHIAEGDRVVMWYPSGNRDDAAFADPFRFDIARHPNPHVSFGGGGPHYCLGASLAKKEVQVMFGALLDRFESVERTGPAAWAGAGPAHNVGASLDELPVRLHPVRATEPWRKN